MIEGLSFDGGDSSLSDKAPCPSAMLPDDVSPDVSKEARRGYCYSMKWIGSLFAAFVKAFAPFLMAVAWEQFFWSLFLIANSAYKQAEYGSGAAAGHRVAYAVLVYLASSSGATILHYLPWHEPAHIFVEVFGHVAGFSFKNVGKALVVLYIPCSTMYPYAIMSISVSAMAMAILAGFRLLFRLPKGLRHLLAHLDVDAFALLCGWLLNDAFRSLISGAEKVDDTGTAALYLWPYLYLSLVVVTHAMMAAEAIPVHKIANCHFRTFVDSLLDLSDRGLTLQLGWSILPSMGVLNIWLFGGVADRVWFGFLSALAISVVGLVAIALWNWQADTCKLERHPRLEDLLSSNPKLTWPSLLSSWDKRPDYVSVGDAEGQLIKPGSFLVCNTYPCRGSPATLAIRVADDKQKESIVHRIWNLFSFTVLHRKIPLAFKPRSLRDFGLMRARGGAWVITEYLEHFKEANISRLSWGFAIGVAWEIFFANAMYKAVDLPLPGEPKFRYCKSSYDDYSSDDYSSPKRLLLAAGDKEGGQQPLVTQMLIQLSIAVASTLILGGIMWWHAVKYKDHGHGHDGDDHDHHGDDDHGTASYGVDEEATGQDGKGESVARSKSANSTGQIAPAVAVKAEVGL